jgi:hypothetical protein
MFGPVVRTAFALIIAIAGGGIAAGLVGKFSGLSPWIRVDVGWRTRGRRALSIEALAVAILACAAWGLAVLSGVDLNPVGVTLAQLAVFIVLYAMFCADVEVIAPGSPPRPSLNSPDAALTASRIRGLKTVAMGVLPSSLIIWLVSVQMIGTGGVLSFRGR